MELKKLTAEVVAIAKEAGQFIKSRQKDIHNLKIEAKSTHNYVTDVDKQSEKFIIEQLQKLLPESGFLAEEQTVQNIKKQ